MGPRTESSTAAVGMEPSEVSSDPVNSDAPTRMPELGVPKAPVVSDHGAERGMREAGPSMKEGGDEDHEGMEDAASRSSDVAPSGAAMAAPSGSPGPEAPSRMGDEAMGMSKPEMQHSVVYSTPGKQAPVGYSTPARPLESSVTAEMSSMSVQSPTRIKFTPTKSLKKESMSGVNSAGGVHKSSESEVLSFLSFFLYTNPGTSPNSDPNLNY